MKKYLLGLIILLLVQLFFSGKSLILSDCLSSIENRIQSLEKENEKLEVEIASSSSLIRISSLLDNTDFAANRPGIGSVALKR